MVTAQAIQSVFSILIIIFIGYMLTHIGWFNEEISKLFSKLVVDISVPALMISNLMDTFDKNSLLSASKSILIPFICQIISYLIAVLISCVIKIPKNRRGVFRVMFSLSNTIFVGLPVNIALFGEKCIPFVLLYYIANTSLFWTIGVYGIRKDSGQSDSSIFSKENLKHIISIPLMAFLLTVLAILMGIKLPKFLLDTCKYIGNLTTPLSLMFIGIIIHSVRLKELNLGMDMIILLIGRFIISPILVFYFVKYMPIETMAKNVFVMESAMPVMTQTAIVAQAYNADHKYATVMITISTVASILFIPLYMVLLSGL